MNIYLLHWVVLYYVVWGVNQWQPCLWPKATSCDLYVGQALQDCTLALDTYNKQRQLPVQHIPTVVIITLALAALTHTFFEKPLRKFLRSKP